MHFRQNETLSRVFAVASLIYRRPSQMGFGITAKSPISGTESKVVCCPRSQGREVRRSPWQRTESAWLQRGPLGRPVPCDIRQYICPPLHPFSTEVLRPGGGSLEPWGPCASNLSKENTASAKDRSPGVQTDQSQAHPGPLVRKGWGDSVARFPVTFSTFYGGWARNAECLPEKKEKKIKECGFL